MTTDDGHGSLGGVLKLGELLGEGLGTDNVKGGHTEQTLGVEDASSLEDLSGDGDGGVDGVGDNQDGGLGAELGDTLDEITHDTGVDLEEVVTGHTRFACIPWLIGPSRPRFGKEILTGNSGRDDNDVSTGQGVLQAIVLGEETGDFLKPGQRGPSGSPGAGG